MKKIYFSFLSFISVVGLNAQSPTLTQANNAPLNGEKYNTLQCDSTGITPGTSGPGSNWDYSSLVTHTAVVLSYTAATSTNTAYAPADISVSSSTANISYLKSSSSDLKYYGGDLQIGGIPATIGYNSPAIYAIYPMSLSTATTVAISGNVSAAGQNGTFTGNSSAIADGTGTLTLPGMSPFNNTLRVVTSQTINFTAGLISGTVNQENFDYYVPGVKASMFTISTATVTVGGGSPSSQTVVTRYQPATVGFAEHNVNVIELSVFPNPSSTFVSFSTENQNAASVSVYDITGRFVSSHSLTNGSLRLDVSGFAAGTYLYKLRDTKELVLKTGKFTVTR